MTDDLRDAPAVSVEVDSAIDEVTRAQAGQLLGELLPTDYRQRSWTAEVLAGGAVNRNLLVKSVDTALVLRIASPVELRRIVGTDMENSVQAGRLAGAAGLGPGLVGARLPDGHLLIEYLAGSTLTHTSLRAGDNLESVGALLARLHDLEPAGLKPRDVFAELNGFLDTAREHGTLPAEFDDLEGPLRTVQGVFAIVEGRTFCHRDVNPQNIIATPEGLRLIDFDYAAVDTPYLDFAMISQYGELSDDEMLRVLTAAVPDLSPVDVARTQLMRFVHAVREWSWCLTAPAFLRGLTDTVVDVLPGGGAGDVDFYEGYERLNLQGALMRMNDDRFGTWVKTAESGLAAPGHPVRAVGR